MDEQVYKKYEAGQVTDTMLQEAAVLFSENYGVWGEKATGKFAKPGKLPQNGIRLLMVDRQSRAPHERPASISIPPP